MHILYLIVGRTASGKDSLIKMMTEKYNLKTLSSYTTRPKRPGETNEHIFITPDEVSQYIDDIAAYTKIGEYEYFATKTQCLESDLYVIDPNGIKFLKERIKDVKDLDLHIIYISADYETRKVRALNKRKDNVIDFEKRCIAEEDQFIDFECEQAWDKRIVNIDIHRAFNELEKYITVNNDLEEI